VIAPVCSGNICRSPTAHVVLEARLSETGLDDLVTVESFGLGGWHVGDRMDDRSAAVLTRAGYDATRHRAQQLLAQRIDDFDLYLAADRSHVAGLVRLGVPRERIRLQRDFDPVEPGGEVPDPYYGGAHGFEEVLGMIERSTEELVASLRALFLDRSGKHQPKNERS
jgi:protein-tyrosine phosphatase